jgi:hypothetical protein
MGGGGYVIEHVFEIFTRTLKLSLNRRWMWLLLKIMSDKVYRQKYDGCRN